MKINWLANNDGAFKVVVDKMREYMGHDENSPIVATCSASPSHVLKYKKKKRVWYGAWNLNEMPYGRHYCLNDLDLAVGISDFCRDVFGKYTDKVASCHLGCDKSIYYHEKKYRDKGHFRVLTTATHEMYGYEHAIKAWEKAVKYMPKSDLLVKDHSNRMSKKQIKRYRNLPQTRFVEPMGWRKTEAELREIYSSADVLLYPALSMGSSMVCMEAMACETPSIIMDYSAPAEFIDSSVGWKVKCSTKTFEPPKGKYDPLPLLGVPDVEEIVDTLVYAYEHQEECWEKGKKGRELIEEEYNWGKVAENFSRILEEKL